MYPTVICAQTHTRCVANSSLLRNKIPDDVLVQLIWCSEFVMLLRWRRMCRSFYTVVASILRSRFRSLLVPFIGPQIGFFADAMRACGAAIAGS